MLELHVVSGDLKQSQNIFFLKKFLNPHSMTSCAVSSAGQQNNKKINSKTTRQPNNCVKYFSLSYLSNPVDLFLICLSDVEDPRVGQGNGCGTLQGCMYSQLTEAVVDTWHLTMHGPTCYDAHL